ncbi:MAG TPA: nitrate/nitrite transporter NrtS [Acidimicrobiales bacterium]|nr:nitrate/nitrite transporter NrtS [Acidimicrobiales bacterium]
MANRDAMLVVTAPTWATPREACALVFRRATLRRTLRIALLVGTILSLVNQGGVIAAGDAGLVTWVRVFANYIVPFCVSSAGFLSATRKPPE